MDATERERIVDILGFWFGPWDEQVPVASAVTKRWFGSSKELDDECRARFEPDVIRAATEHYSRWRETAEGSVALVLLLDQLPRNIYRGTRAAFAQDVIAREVTHHAVEQGIHHQLTLPQRLFLYMPLMHSEILEAHDAARTLFGHLLADARAQGSKNLVLYEQAHGSAQKHRAIIERFGRYPNRNAILGRASTREELEFLKQPGSSF